MGNREYYEKKLEVINAIKDSQIKKPHHIPVAVYIQEADNLYQWAMDDKEALISAGLARELIEDLPQRCGALIEAETQWQKQRETRNKSALEWDKQSPIAYDLRKRLLADFHFAFRKHPDLKATLREIAQIEDYSKLIQDLNDLSVLGNANTRLLEVIKFDLSLLDKAAQTSREMSVLLAEMNRDTEKKRHSEVKKIRDQAYTHLKEAVDEIRETGRYLSRRNKERLRGYASEYRRHIKSKEKRKLKKKATK